MRIQPIPGGLGVLAPAKINLHLEVGGLLLGGFHEIDSLFHAVTLHDELELVLRNDGEIRLEEDGIAAGEKNLVFQAARKLRECGIRSPLGRPGVTIRLKKRIPQGAGLGGGSSDAAATLLALTLLWHLPVEHGRLSAWAAELGSDVPFFLVGGTARCRGRGERVESWNEPASHFRPLHFVLACPRIPVATRDAYGWLDAARGPDFALTRPSPLDSMRPASLQLHLGCGKVFLNDFQEVVFSRVPELRSIHAALSRELFTGVLLTGSGSAMFGILPGPEEADAAVRRLKARLELDQVDLFVVSSERPHDGSGLSGFGSLDGSGSLESPSPLESPSRSEEGPMSAP